MTTQMPDEVRYRGHWYSITAVDGAGLFRPGEHGLETPMLSTACWRGFRCWYLVRHGRLVLHRLEVGGSGTAPRLLGGSGTAPRLLGVKARRAGRDAEHENAWQFTGLDAPMPFSGKLLVGRGYVRAGYLNMGFLPAWHYRTIHDLAFTAGRLARTTNRSAALAVVRARRRHIREGGKDWIDRTFSLSYAYSWPTAD